MGTEEKAFNDALDANPEDHTTRLVYADWLDEHDDPRAAGYRAMGRRMIFPHRSAQHPLRALWNATAYSLEGRKGPWVPGDWFVLLRSDLKDQKKPTLDTFWLRFSGRRGADDALALAFLLLPPERQAELLTPAVPAASG